MKHIICYSGGHSSALVAIEVARRYGKENTILLNHDINSNVEGEDIKRFKKQISVYLQIPITYKNYNDLPLSNLPDQFDICEELGSFVNPATRQGLCTTYLKTIPFTKYLEEYFTDKNCIIYYGFDKNEPNRIERRQSILGDMGYNTDFPLSLWGKDGIDLYNEYQIKQSMNFWNKANPESKYKDPYLFIDENINFLEFCDIKDYSSIYKRTIFSTIEVGIEPPNSYSHFKHANCDGCLKGGQQHWYVTYVKRPDIFERAKLSESRIGYSIIKDNPLIELESKFSKMKCAGIEASEHIPFQTFWAEAKKILKNKIEEDEKPCECYI